MGSLLGAAGQGRVPWSRLFWYTGAEVGTRQIGTDAKETAPRLLIVHGKQRLTSLFAVLTGTPILAKDYTKGPPKSTHG
jgi:hypothetical protein